MRLAPISRREQIRRLRNLGWSGPYAGGRHQHMVQGDVQLTLPNLHGGGEIGVNLPKIVLDEARISRGEWLSAR